MCELTNRSCFGFDLPHHLQRELDAAVIHRGRCHPAYSVRGVDVGRWVREDSAVDDVVGLSAELRMHPLVDREVLER